MSEFNMGDRVRVVIEGEITRITPYRAFYLDQKVYVSNHLVATAEEAGIVTIEVLERAVETFKPGDIVRSRMTPKYTYALADEGYVDLYNGIWNESAFAVFTSDHYEKIEVQA